MENKHLYKFEDFVLDLNEQTLIQNEKIISITPKVFLLLKVLVENHRKIVEKEDLMKQVWEDSFVEDSNLTYTIRQLRKILGDDIHQPKFIETVPRRGYRFIADVRFEETVILPDISETIQTHIPEKSTFSLRWLYLLPISLTVILATGWFVNNYFSKQTSTEFEYEILTRNGDTRHAAISSDGKFMVYVNRVNEHEGLWLRSLERNTNIQIGDSTDESFYALRVSKQNDIYYVRAKLGELNSLFQTSLIGGSPKKIITDLRSEFAISPDSKKIAFVRNINNADEKVSVLMIKIIETGEEIRIKDYQLPFKVESVEWSNDNQSIFFAAGESESGQQNIELWRINTANLQTDKLSPDKWFQVKSISWVETSSELILLGRKKLSEQNRLWKISYPSGKTDKFLTDPGYYTDFTLAENGKKILAVQSLNNFFLYLADTEKPNESKQLVKSYRGLSWTKEGNIVYVANVNGNDDIWTISPDGTNNKQLTFDDSTDYLPRISPVDNSIFYVSDKSGETHIWKMDANGTNNSQITDNKGGICPSVHPSGEWLAYNLTKEETLWKMKPDGSDKQPLTNLKGIRPSFSPNGEMLAFIHNPEIKGERGGIAVINFANGEIINKFKVMGKGVSSWRILWKPDNSGFYYSSHDDYFKANLWFQALDNSPPIKTTNFNDQQIFDMDFSPDGKSIAFIRGGWEKDAVIISSKK